MTYNNGYVYHKDCEPNRDCSKCKLKHPKPQKVLLECGEGTESRTFTSSNDAPFQLAYVTVDTTCLNRPEILIKFSSIVSMELTDFIGTVRLQYELFNVCKDEKPKSLGIWMFEEVNLPSNFFNRLEETFDFMFCECTNRPKCCEYFVTVTPIEISNAEVTVSNGSMAALSQSLCGSLEDKYKSSGKHPKPKEILLACGQGNGRMIFRGGEPPIDIAHVQLNTTCLNKPKALIEFSSIIKFDERVDTVRLQFELFRVCGNGEPLSRGIWIFERRDIIGTLELDKAFSFIFCECSVPSKCCEYFVTVTPLVEENDPRADVEVGNVRMVALAQSSRDGLNYYDSEIFSKKGDCIDYAIKSPTSKKILLECGDGSGSRTFTSSSDETTFQLAHVTMDTTYLCKPVVNIEFSSMVSFEGVGDVQLRYELLRVCNNKTPISIGVWSVDRFNTFSSGRSTGVFSFVFCDCITCSGCCDYFVTVTPMPIQPQSTVQIKVSNGNMAAIAGEA